MEKTEIDISKWNKEYLNRRYQITILLVLQNASGAATQTVIGKISFPKGTNDRAARDRPPTYRFSTCEHYTTLLTNWE